MADILQLCPHDSMPFGTLCGHFEQAAASIDANTSTVFFAPASGAAHGFADYLDATDMADIRRLADGLAPYAGRSWDLVLCHRYRAYRAAVAAGLTRSPTLVLAHEYGLLDRWQRRLHRKLFGRACRFAGVAPDVAAELDREALVLPNVIDLETPAEQPLERAEATAALGLTQGPTTIAVVGRLHYKKRPQLALQAFERYARHDADARLVYLGEGDERPALAAQAAANVHLLGTVAGAARLFSAFDVVLHTAAAEPFGMVVLEAMRAGVPVVTLPAHGPAFILGELGVYPSADDPDAFAAAIARALELDRGVLAGAGLERIRRHFSIGSLARQLERLLTEPWG